MNIEYVTVFPSFFLCLFSLFFFSLVHTHWHTLSFSEYSCATSVDREWVCVNFCIHYHNYIFKCEPIFCSDWITFTFQTEKLIAVLLWCGQRPTRESCSVLLGNTCGRGTPLWHVSRFFDTFTCPLSRERRPSPHLLWSLKEAFYCTWPPPTWHARCKALDLNINTHAAQWRSTPRTRTPLITQNTLS